MARPFGMLVVVLLAFGSGPPSGGTGTAAARAAPEDVDLKEAVRLLGSDRSAWRERAARDLGKMGADAATAAPALVKALRDDEHSVREAAADALGLVGVKDDSVLRALERTLKDPWPSAQIAAAASLGRLDPAGKSGLPVLLGYLRGSGKDPRAREAALRGLVPYGARAAEAVPTITGVLKEGSALEKGSALNALGAIGPKALPALPTILGLIGSGDPYLRSCAVTAAGGIGPEAADTGVPVLRDALKKGRDIDHHGILEALGRMGPAALPVIEEYLGTPGRNPLAYGSAIEALGAIGKEAVPALEKLLQRTDSSIVENAVKALMKAGVPAERMIPLLASALDRGEAFSGLALTSALATFGEVAVPALVEVLRGGKPSASLLALNALDKMGPAGRGAIPAVEVVAASGDVVLAPLARETLRRLREAPGK